LALDREGNLYVADSRQNRVRRIDAATGIITTVAGNGRSGFGGDGGPGHEAALQTPTSLAVNTAGALLITDSANHRVRQLANGIITTVAGTGTQGSGGDGGPATAAQLMRPGGIGVDSAGSLYIVDSGNGSVRRIDAAGQITTVVHTPRKDLQALAVGSGGAVFVAGNDRPQVFRYDRDMEALVPAAGSGAQGFSGDGVPAVEAALGDRLGLAVGGGGELLIADLKNRRLRRVDAAGLITTIAGTGELGRPPEGGPALRAILSPVAVAVHPDGAVLVSDSRGYVFRIERDGTITKVAGGGFGF
jgi:sugar lactone lactonase YvrE